MTDLITIDDLEPRLGRQLTTAELRRTPALLADVSAAIRAYTGQQFTEGSATSLLRVRRNKVRLPQRPVNDVHDVVDTDDRAVTWTWNQSDIIRLWLLPPDTFEIEYPVRETEWVVVTYDYGYATLPPDLVAVASSIAARSIGQTPTMTGIMSESIAGYSYSIGAVAASGPFGLLDPEKALLDRYKRKAGYIDSEINR